MSPELDSVFENLQSIINKKYGKDSNLLIKLNDQSMVLPEEDLIRTGSIALDFALGIGGFQRGRIVEVQGGESSGKAQPLSSKILTPSGWKIMGEIEIGDIVCTPDGKTSTVIGVFPQGEQDVHKITMDDKSSTFCTLDHLWWVNTRKNDMGEVLTTKEIIEEGITRKGNSRKFKIPFSKPIELNQYNEITIDPYLLGLLLGDGSFVESTIKYTTSDSELLDAIRCLLKNNYKNMELSNKIGKYSYHLKKKTKGHKRSELRLQLEKLDLADKLSIDKHIPKEYLYTSVDNRIALLQGLMDSDGSVGLNGSISFTTSSKQLSEDFQFLVRSLGIRCTTSPRVTKYTSSTGEKVDGLESYRSNMLLTDLSIIPVRLKYKKDRLTNKLSDFRCRFIESIEYSHREKCQCIAIGHPEQLYITDDFIVTHNTTICLHAVANVQKMGGNCLYIDSEHATDPKYAKALGVDFDKLYFSQPDYGEQALDILDMSIKTGKIALAVIDSVAALVPKAELEGEMEDVQIGLQARMMSKAMRKITAVASHTNTAVIFINQTRASIGMGMGNVGTGGNALKFYASQRLKISRLGSTTSGSKFDSKGNKTQVQVIKNKLAPPFKVAEFPITFGIGIDRLEEIVALAASDGIIKKGGAWFTYEEQKFQGTENMRMFLQENPEIADKIERELRENRGLI